MLSCFVFGVHFSTISSISTCSRRSTCVLIHHVGDYSVCRSNCCVMQNTTQVVNVLGIDQCSDTFVVKNWTCSEYKMLFMIFRPKGLHLRVLCSCLQELPQPGCAPHDSHGREAAAVGVFIYLQHHLPFLFFFWITFVHLLSFFSHQV